MFSTVIAAITTLFTLAGFGFYLVAFWGARSWLRRRRFPLGFAPAVSILKPLRGVDPGMVEAFASHCRQQYGGDYEILFGVSSTDDPAAALVQQLQAEFPQRSIRLILCPETLGPNGKVSNLAQLEPHARFDYLVINDSDIRVSPHYLARVLAPFGPQSAAAPERKPTGLVTALYHGRAHGTLGSKLESLGISTDFIPALLSARVLEGGLHFGLGSTLAVTRPALHSIGGLRAVVDYIADDYQLGLHIDRAGFRVELCDEIVETAVPAYTVREFLDHQLRWMRTVRDSRPAGYFGMGSANLLAWAFLNLIASGVSLFSIALFSMALLFRVSIALGVGVGILDDRQVLRDLWLLLPRDLLHLAVWAWSYASDAVVWRGERFIVRKGKLIRATNQALNSR
ncbi:MAG TPA: bacteriohopanetetrol glucosamine biosynthesis glycosyltransferase HpnI [Acidobacteriaceae bacterium]|jgi:ceramide glucosyltransferase|nr:bacteriohopanetetrol glucosamine biosynthesis glycosyltransferase HpnI [Acidobacteriaceae bacterium]